MDENYIKALELLGEVCYKYGRASGGDTAWLVGGASVVVITDGEFHSGDFDLVVANQQLFEAILREHGFQEERGQGMLQIGFMHTDHPDLGWQLVTGPLFGGKTDTSRRIAYHLKEGSEITLPPYEDIIADRLAQFAAQDGKSHFELVKQARMIFRLAKTIDRSYLEKRILAEGGDLLLLDE
jgi:hypothetical protein